MTTVLVPDFGAGNGVAGARMTSTSAKTARIASRNQARKRCAWITHAAGTIAPDRSRSRTSGSKSPARVLRRGQVERRRFGGGDDIGGGAGPRRLGDNHLAAGAERGGDLVDRGIGFRHCGSRK